MITIIRVGGNVMEKRRETKTKKFSLPRPAAHHASMQNRKTRTYSLTQSFLFVYSRMRHFVLTALICYPMLLLLFLSFTSLYFYHPLPLFFS